MDTKRTPTIHWSSDTEFFWFLYKLIQANLLKYFKEKQSEASKFVECLAKLHSESMCAELVLPASGKSKKGKAPTPLPQLPKPANDAPTPETLTSWTRDSEFYMFLYQILLRNKGHFKSQLKPTESFISVLTKLHSKAMNREYSTAAATASSGGAPEKFKVIELAEENVQLQQEIASLKAQLGLVTSDGGPKNGTLKGSVKK